MRSYHHYCGLAKALDVVGDRWSLLIVRELLARPCRYRDLVDGLPGVATNLLAERLRDLEAAGVVGKEAAGCYVLTEWGQGLADPIYALGRWAAPLMGEMHEDDAFRSHWLVHPIQVIFGGPDPRRPALTVELRTGDGPMTIESVAGEIRVRPGQPRSPDLVVSGPPNAILGLLAGRLNKAQATAYGVSVLGDVRRLRRLRPKLASSPVRVAAAAAR